MPDHLRTVCITYCIYFTIKENQTLNFSEGPLSDATNTKAVKLLKMWQYFTAF